MWSFNHKILNYLIEIGQIKKLWYENWNIYLTYYYIFIKKKLYYYDYDVNEGIQTRQAFGEKIKWKLGNQL
jgi:hypothetical protein